MSRWPLPFVIAFAALALQACDQRPAQTTVSPPQASLPDDASLRAPAMLIDAMDPSPVRNFYA